MILTLYDIYAFQHANHIFDILGEKNHLASLLNKRCIIVKPTRKIYVLYKNR